MPSFAANLSMMYTEVPFPDRFEAAAQDGFHAVECQFPYAWPAPELAARLRGNGLQMVLLNAPPGGTDAASATEAASKGLRGVASLPGRETELRAGVALALHYAELLDCPRIHVMAGAPQEAGDSPLPTYTRNLSWAAEQAAAAGREILIEPLNPRDAPGYFLNRQRQAHDVVQSVGAANLKVQMDLYHCQVAEGDVAMLIREFLPTGRVGHLQVAGAPERNEPDIGEMNYRYLFDVIDEVTTQSGWQGWVGCEYRPLRAGQPGGTSAGLDWFRARLAHTTTRR